MSIIITIIVFILVFSLLILVHELGHFLMAKRAGIEVKEFGFGLPPRLWGWKSKKSKTIYSINWIPFGGFVRMLGEDATDPTMMKKKKSFIAQPMRARVKVVIAGVVMNFLLAWILLTVGFSVGMQPLLAPADVLPAVNDGLIHLEEGVKIKNLEEGGLAQRLGFQVDDTIVSINDVVVDDFNLLEMVEDPVGIYQVLRDGSRFTYEVTEEGALGIEFYDFVSFPRVKVFEVSRASKMYRAGLREGDYLISANDQQIFSVFEYEEIVRGVSNVEYEVYRDGERQTFLVEFDRAREVIVSSVLPGSPAEVVGFISGDVILSVNGNNMDDSMELISFVDEHSDEVLAYAVERDGRRLFFEVKPEEGKIGVLLSELLNYGEMQDVSLYNVNLMSSVVKIDNVRYPWYEAAYKSVGEGYRLAKLTGQMFIGVVADLLKGGEVPDTIAGPVGIASLTHVFVQEGFMSVLRFVAVLSLSLGVINILPFPALDGGRLLFIFIELIIGRRVNQKWESYIHGLGYLLLLLLIFVITWSDIAKLL